VVMLIHIVGGFIARALRHSARFSMAVYDRLLRIQYRARRRLQSCIASGVEWRGAGLGDADRPGCMDGRRPTGSTSWRAARGCTCACRCAASSPGALAILAIGGTGDRKHLALRPVAGRAAQGGGGPWATRPLRRSAWRCASSISALLPGCSAYCSGAEAVFGFAHGAGDRLRLHRATGLVTAMAILYGLAWSAAAIAFARPLLSPFAPRRRDAGASRPRLQQPSRRLRPLGQSPWSS